MKRQKNIYARLKILFALIGTMILLLISPSIATAGTAYLILDAKSGRILASENADVPNHPASLTKMMTLYLTFEALKSGKLSWNSKVRFSRHAASRPPTKLWVQAGSSITVREAVLGMIVPSANDAAAAIGEKLAGSEAAFARMMTAKARQLGMKRTVFTNASGLPSRKQVTTARDMSTLAVALMNDFPANYKLFSTPSFKFRGRTVHGHNNLMYRYAGMDGFKTGYTNASGFNLVSAVKNGNRRVIGVIMGGRTARGRDAKMAALLNAYIPRAFNGKSSTLIASVSSIHTMRAAIENPPVPTHALRPHLADSQLASASKEVANLITTTALNNLGNAVSSHWQVQIGATDSRKDALALLNHVASSFGRSLAGATPHTEAVSQGTKTLYRARFVGFDTHDAARDACNLLDDHHIACFIVPSAG